jgi:hypothetical protein
VCFSMVARSGPSGDQDPILSPKRVVAAEFELLLGNSLMLVVSRSVARDLTGIL